MSTNDTTPKGRIDTEHATAVEDAPRWRGPFTEYSQYGEPTGAEYVRCSACGVEVLAGDTRHATHRPGCDGVEE
jgi:hypothetical protein